MRARNQWLKSVVGTVVMTALCAHSVLAQQPSSDSEMLRKEIEALKQGQAAIQKDVQEIKALLKSRPAQPAPQIVGAIASVEGAPVKGDQNAKVTIIEYTEYQCPFSGRHARDVLPQIDKEYIATGKVRYVFRNFPLDFHKNAFPAASAALCAGEQGKYWEMHDRFFANQQALDSTNLVAHAEAVGLDMKKFQECLDSGKNAAAIRKDLADAGKIGIGGTPGFVLGLTEPNDPKIKVVKFISGAQPYATFKAAIDELLTEPQPQK